MRKIVQISTNHQSGSDEELSVFALCDDGTLWFTICGRDFGNVPAKISDDWNIVANVPQDSIEDNDYIWFSQQGY
ncbi:MAG: hypothetical protein ACO23R_16790 [bacterium]